MTEFWYGYLWGVIVMFVVNMIVRIIRANRRN